MSIKLPLVIVLYMISFVSLSQHSDEISYQQILLVYSAEELESMKEDNPSDYAKLLFYYGHSWELKRSQTSETELDKDKIDVSRFEDQRAEDSQVEIVISQYNDKIILLSKKELEEAYALLESQH